MQQAIQERLQAARALRAEGYNPSTARRLADLFGRAYEPLAGFDDLRRAFEAADMAFFASGCSRMPGQLMAPLEPHRFASAFYSADEWEVTRAAVIAQIRTGVRDMIALLDLATVSSSIFATTNPLSNRYPHPTVEGADTDVYITAQAFQSLDPSGQARVNNMLQSFAETIGVQALTRFHTLNHHIFSWQERSHGREHQDFVTTQATERFAYNPESPNNVYHPHPFGYFHTILSDDTDHIGPLDALQASDLHRRLGRVEEENRDLRRCAREAEGQLQQLSDQLNAVWERLVELEAQTSACKRRCRDRDFIISALTAEVQSLRAQEAVHRDDLAPVPATDEYTFSTAAEIDALAGTQHRVIGLVSICSVVSNTTS
ncbi:hypothetical protein EV122DRAFT_277562 [Schizophyllum commune]